MTNTPSQLPAQPPSMPSLMKDMAGPIESVMEALGRAGRDSLLYTEVLVSAGILAEGSFAHEDADIVALRRLLVEPDGAAHWNDDIAARFMRMRARKEAPVCLLAEIGLPLAAMMGIDATHALIRPLLMAVILGGVPSQLPYHNHHHIREVVALTCALGCRWLKTAGMAGAPAFVGELLIAACLHDFAHDGQGNRRYDVHSPMRLEQRSVEKTWPYMKAAGMTEAAWERIVAMVLATDVSKANAGSVSPTEWLRRAYAGDQGDTQECPPGMEILFADPRLAQQAALLEDADLGVSAAMPYAHARRMTALVCEETRLMVASPQTLIGFLDHICHGAFITKQAREVFGDNIARIRAQAEKDDADTFYYWS